MALAVRRAEVREARRGGGRGFGRGVGMVILVWGVVISVVLERFVLSLFV